MDKEIAAILQALEQRDNLAFALSMYPLRELYNIKQRAYALRKSCAVCYEPIVDLMLHELRVAIQEQENEY